MPDRKPEPWRSGAAGPFLWIEGSPVEVWLLGEDRFAVRALTTYTMVALRAALQLRFESTGGVALTQPIVNVYTLAHGKLKRVEGFRDRFEALKAVVGA